MTEEEFSRRPRMLCSCGNLQMHTLQRCHDCGGEFSIRPTSKSFAEVILMHALAYQGNIVRSLEWFHALNRRKMDQIPFEEFRAAYEEALNTATTAPRKMMT